MRKGMKIKIANGWLSLMWLGFATTVLITGAKYPIVVGCVIGGLLVIRMTIWAIKTIKQ